MIADNYLTNIMHHMPRAVNKGKDINFSDRTCYHKVARVLYRFFRFIYIAVIYYFLPFIIVLM